MSLGSELLQRLRSAKTAATARQALQALEDRLTPIELAAMLPSFEDLPSLAKLVCQSSLVLQELLRNPPQPYVRRDLAADVALFHTPELSSGQKSLIVAFCGRTSRVMLPCSLFLQYLPASLFDVLILADRSNLHYFAGIQGYAPDLRSLAQRIRTDVDAALYRRLYCYGTSSGGFPALRFGILTEAYRSISVAGTLTWPIYRLQSGNALQSFDPLCVCNANPRGHLVCVHADGAHRDSSAAQYLQRFMQISRIPVAGSDEHNVVYKIYKAGGLPSFHAQLFDFNPQLLNLQRSVGS